MTPEAEQVFIEDLIDMARQSEPEHWSEFRGHAAQLILSRYLRKMNEATLQMDRLKTLAISFLNEAPREGDLALMLLSMSGTQKREYAPMIEAYAKARKALVDELTPKPAENGGAK